MNRLPTTPGEQLMARDRLRDSALDLLERGFVALFTAGAMLGGAFLLLFCEV